MTGYQSKKAMAQDKLNDDDDTQVYKDHGDALTTAYMSGFYDGKKAAQPAQEPVAWRNAAVRIGEELSSVGPDGYYDMTAQQWLDWAMEQKPRGKNSLAQPPAQKPEIWGCKFNKGNRLDTFYTKSAAERYVEGALRNGADVSLVGLYTTPPQRPWVGLTAEEAAECWTTSATQTWKNFEAKLKEKNT